MKKHDKSEGDINISPQRIRWQREQLDDATRELLDRDQRHFLAQSLSTPCLNALQACEGIYIEDLHGRRYMDFHGNNVHQVGFGNPEVVAAIKEQLDTLSFCTRRYTNETAVNLAETLAGLAPGDLNKVLFCPGGGEAIFRQDIGPLLPGTEHVPPPDPSRAFYDLGDPEKWETFCARYVEYILQKEGDIAAVIAEPIRSTPYVPSAEYWRIIRRACDKHGALLIFDEIRHALGRTGKMFTCQNFDVIPDILCIGKGLGGGIMPLAAVIARDGLNVAGDRALDMLEASINEVEGAS